MWLRNIFRRGDKGKKGLPSAAKSPVIPDLPRVEGSKVIVSQNIMSLIENLKAGAIPILLTNEVKETVLLLGVTVAELRDIEEQQDWKKISKILISAKFEGRIAL